MAMKRVLVAITISPIIAFSSAALASQRVKLDNSQMDKVTAGAATNFFEPPDPCAACVHALPTLLRLFPPTAPFFPPSPIFPPPQPTSRIFFPPNPI